MSSIRILPEALANQIAAGEVVERPASAVKECVENSIDAGASHIEVHSAGAGTRLIRIVDDGIGMDADDILLCLERHATSKLTSTEGLFAIATLGFRGEAIPSIASVSRLTITSCHRDNPLGTRVEVRFGKVMQVTEMGCRKGTVIEIQDLFGNVPARRKFLKSAATETAHLEEIVRNCALARPAIGFHCEAEGRVLFSLPPGETAIADRWRLLFGRPDGGRVAGARDGSGATGMSRQTPLITVDLTEEAAGQHGPCRLYGLLLPPEENAAAAAGLRLFVNGRVVKDRMLAHAVAEGLQSFLMKGRKPVGALFLEVPPASVDVNVHPTKQEVRFHRPQTIHQFVALAIGQAMTAFQRGLRGRIFGPAREDPPPHEPLFAAATADRLDGGSVAGAREGAGATDRPDGGSFAGASDGAGATSLPVPPRPAPLTTPKPRPRQEGLFPAAPLPWEQVEIAAAPSLAEPLMATDVAEPPTFLTPLPSTDRMEEVSRASGKTQERPTDWTEEVSRASGMAAQERPTEYFEPAPMVMPAFPPHAATAREQPDSFRYLGQLHNSFLLCETGDGLAVIDQHAAQERLCYERLKGQYLAGGVAVQQLLFPAIVELAADEARLATTRSDDFAGLGLILEPFGGKSFVIKGVPALMAHLDPQEILRGVLAALAGEAGAASRRDAARMETMLAAMACKAAVKAGAPLTPAEAQALIRQMGETGVFSHCPHGRPVLKYFGRQEIRKWFHR